MILPNQKVSNKEKFSINKETNSSNVRDTANYYIDQIGANDHHDEIIRLFKFLDFDFIDERDYNYVLNPFNTKIEKYTKFRGKLRNFNIIAPVIEMFLSEYGRRNHNPSVLQSNPLDETAKEKALNEFWRGYYNQRSVNKLNELGVNTGKPTVEQPDEKEAKEDFERNYSSDRIIEGKIILDYILYSQDVKDKYIDLYLNYLVCGRPITYKAVRHNDVEFEVIPPHEAYFPHSINKKRIEERDWFIRKYKATPSQIKDDYGDVLSDSLLQKIDDYNSNNNIDGINNHTAPLVFVASDELSSKYSVNAIEEENGCLLYHVVYKSLKRIGVLKYINKIGKEVEEEVEDNYKLDRDKGDISISYVWKNCIYEVLKVILNDEEDYIIERELPYDRSELNNSSANLLPYNGLALTTISGEIKSIVKSGINYQTIYNILKYSFEKTMNKNKGKISVIPLGLINKGKRGWDEEKSMYYAEANDTLFIDETSPNAALALQGLKVLDQSLGQYAKETIAFCEQIKQEWWDSVGMNRQRYGETLASDGKATNEQAIFRSSLITENSLRTFEKLQEKDYLGLLDLSKFAFIEGKKGDYINSEGRQAFLNLNLDGAVYHSESSYNIYLIFSKEEEEKIERLKDYVFNFTQNGGDLSIALDALDIKSFALGKEMIKKEEKLRKKTEQEEAQKDREVQENIEASQANTAEAERELRKYEADLKYKGVVDAASIRNTPVEEEGEEVDLSVETKTSVEIEELKAKIKKLEAETNQINNNTVVNK